MGLHLARATAVATAQLRAAAWLHQFHAAARLHQRHSHLLRADWLMQL